MQKHIDELLHTYWEGETSLEEEQEIRDYFKQENIAPEHEAFRPYFSYITEQQNITYSLPDTEKIRSLAGNKQNVIRISTFRKYMYAAAAVFSVILASWFIFQNIQKQPEQIANIQEIEDPEEAYRVTMAALAMVSGKLNKGTESIELGLENVNKANIFK